MKPVEYIGVRTVWNGKRYLVAVKFGEHEFWLTPTRVWRYCATALDAAGRATHDAAVIKQMQQDLSADGEKAVYGAALLRAKRKPLDEQATTPLRFNPGVSARDGSGFIDIHGPDETYTQISAPKLIEHVTYVLSAASTAPLDTVYRQFLVDEVKVGEAIAERAVTALSNYFEDEADGE